VTTPQRSAAPDQTGGTNLDTFEGAPHPIWSSLLG
jgi:hypothetical protein